MFGFLCKPLISGTLEEQKMGKSRTYLSAVRQYAFARPSLMPGIVLRRCSAVFHEVYEGGLGSLYAGAYYDYRKAQLAGVCLCLGSQALGVRFKKRGYVIH